MTINDRKLSAEEILAMLGKTFEKRAKTWEQEEGEIGKIVAAEIRTVNDAYRETINPTTK